MPAPLVFVVCNNLGYHHRSLWELACQLLWFLWCVTTCLITIDHCGRWLASSTGFCGVQQTGLSPSITVGAGLPAPLVFVVCNKLDYHHRSLWELACQLHWFLWCATTWLITIDHCGSWLASFTGFCGVQQIGLSPSITVGAGLPAMRPAQSTQNHIERISTPRPINIVRTRHPLPILPPKQPASRAGCDQARECVTLCA